MVWYSYIGETEPGTAATVFSTPAPQSRGEHHTAQTRQLCSYNATEWW